jgi:hypothetical protein
MILNEPKQGGTPASKFVIKQENKPKWGIFLALLPLLRTCNAIQFKKFDFNFTFLKIKIRIKKTLCGVFSKLSFSNFSIMISKIKKITLFELCLIITSWFWFYFIFCLQSNHLFKIKFWFVGCFPNLHSQISTNDIKESF